MRTDSGKALHTTEQAAAAIGVKPDTVRKYVQRDQLIPAIQIGRAYLFDAEVISRFIAQRENAAKAG